MILFVLDAMIFSGVNDLFDNFRLGIIPYYHFDVRPGLRQGTIESGKKMAWVWLICCHHNGDQWALVKGMAQNSQMLWQ